MSASAHASFPFRDRQMQAKLPIPGAVTANSYLACTCSDLDPEAHGCFDAGIEFIFGDGR